MAPVVLGDGSFEPGDGRTYRCFGSINFSQNPKVETVGKFYEIGVIGYGIFDIGLDAKIEEFSPTFSRKPPLRISVSPKRAFTGIFRQCFKTDLLLEKSVLKIFP
jgi:hypothetical protein